MQSLVFLLLQLLLPVTTHLTIPVPISWFQIYSASLSQKQKLAKEEAERFTGLLFLLKQDIINVHSFATRATITWVPLCPGAGFCAWATSKVSPLYSKWEVYESSEMTHMFSLIYRSSQGDSLHCPAEYPVIPFQLYRASIKHWEICLHPCKRSQIIAQLFCSLEQLEYGSLVCFPLPSPASAQSCSFSHTTNTDCNLTVNS